MSLEMSLISEVTIIIPSYNHAAFLRERLDSIVNQTYKKFKIIIIDDHSTDGSQLILNEFVNSHPEINIKFIKNVQNSGSGYMSWKKGLQLADTTFIWIAETDDYCEHTFLEDMISILDSDSELKLAFCANINVNVNGQIISDSSKRTSVLNVKEGDYGVFEQQVYLDNMPFKTLITNASGVVFRLPQDAPLDFLFGFKQCSDIFFWTYLLQFGKMAFLNKPLNYFRRHSNATTIQMNKTKLKNVYKEKIHYLNYYNLHDKQWIFLKNYVYYYLWNFPKEIFKNDFLLKLERSTFIKIKYYLMVLIVFPDRLLNKIYNKTRK